MSVAFAEAMAGTGGTIVLVDLVPELLDVATARVREAAGPLVEVHAVRADAGSDELLSLVPVADLVFASFVVHHLPDQQRGLDRLAALVSPGGRLAVVEDGLGQRCLPWDVGVGEPGLQGRLAAALGEWFRGMRTGIDGAVRLPVGRSGIANAGRAALRRPGTTWQQDMRRHLEDLRSFAAGAERAGWGGAWSGTVKRCDQVAANDYTGFGLGGR